MATCAVSGNIISPAGAVVVSTTVEARVNQGTFSSTSLVMPLVIGTTTDSSGNWVLTVQQSLTVMFTVSYPPTDTDPVRKQVFTATIPATTTASFSSIVASE
jgi:hypothetical protein